MLPPRAYARLCNARTWEEIWEAGPYYDRISRKLEEARKFAVFVGWQIDSRLTLPGPRGFESLKQKILRICEERPDFQFYFLIWDHAYIYVLERERWQGRIWDGIHPRVHFVFDNRHPFGGSHHEKLCLIDGEVAFCGGIDLCDERWDSPFHFAEDARRSLSHRSECHGPYHDLAVQVSGPIYREIHAHVARRWKKLTNTPFPRAARGESIKPQAGDSKVYFSRTLPQIDGGKIIPTREIEFLFRNLIGMASRRIILEGQYYWSEELNDLLIAKMHEMRGKDFEVILILADLSKTKSLTRHMYSYELLLLEKLRRAAQYAGTRLKLGFPYSSMKSVYVHSKVLLIDDRYLSIGSANFAARAFRLDSEVNLTLEAKDAEERAHIERFAERVLRHWGVHLHESHTGAALREINPATLLDQIHDFRFKALAKKFFDPNVSGLYWLKVRLLRRARQLGKKPLPLFVTLIAAMWLLWAGFALFARTPSHPHAIALSLLAAMLSLCWILPFPFLPAALLGALLTTPETGARVAVVAAWIASFWGYAMARAFPNAAARYYRKILPFRPSKRLGARRFSETLALLLDPKLSVQSKIAYPGLRYIPFPWFFFTHGVLLPGMVYLGTLAVSELADRALGRTAALASVAFWLALLTLDGLLKIKRWPSTI